MSATLPALGGRGQASLTTSDDCAWTAVVDRRWLELTSPPSGSGPAAIEWRAGANPSRDPRVARVTVAGRTVTVEQAGAVEQFAISGDVVSLSGSCPSAAFSIGTRRVHVSEATRYVRGDCDKLKTGRHVQVLGLLRADGGLDAIEVGFDADQLL
jgi:hypothetical protein